MAMSVKATSAGLEPIPRIGRSMDRMAREGIVRPSAAALVMTNAARRYRVRRIPVEIPKTAAMNTARRLSSKWTVTLRQNVS